MDVNTGEVIALESLPDYDPEPADRRPRPDQDQPHQCRRLRNGLDLQGAVDRDGAGYRARSISARGSTRATRLRYGRFTIHDFHATHRILTVPEVFTHSSNIGTARMALMVGVEGHKAFLKKMGQLDRLHTELPENAEPLVPKRWSELNTMTIAFGQGLNVAPAAGGDGRLRAGERRPHDAADLPAAKPGGGRQDQPQGGERPDVRIDALSHAIERDPRLGDFRQYSRATTSAARRARRTRSSTATIRRTRCSPLSWRSRRPTSRNTSIMAIYDDPRRRAGGLRIPHRRVERGPHHWRAYPQDPAAAGRGSEQGRAEPIHSPSSPAWAMEPTPTRSARSNARVMRLA